MNKKTVPHSIRQGDVLLVAASYRGWKDGQPVASAGSRTVLEYGEVTGHAHAFKASPNLGYFDANAERFLEALTEQPMTHEEHSAVFVSPKDPASGRYQRAFQVEEQGEEIRPVAD